MRTTTVVIGAGHAGLAMSRCLSLRSIDHVVLERGEVANSWRTERWDSLKLLTPNWQSRLPGYAYEGEDPDGYRTMPETVGLIDRYAESMSAPVQTHTVVHSVRGTDDGYTVATNRGTWSCKTVVLATGACNLPNIPKVAAGIPSGVRTMSPLEYRNPGQLEEGGVLVVGGSASGIQIAEELQRSGRPVTMSLGAHIRAPRVYRGRDIQWWMDRVGVLDEFYTEVDSVERVRAVPSLQLIGSDERRTLDLNALTDVGVTLAGRLVGVRDGCAQFSGSLRNACQMADLKMGRLLDRIDEWVAEQGCEADFDAPTRFEPTRVAPSPPVGLDFEDRRIKTVIWATGFRPDYSWLDVPVLDAKGRVRHDGGVVASPGLYLMGMPFLRRRKSSLIDGAGSDAYDLSAHLAAYLRGQSRAPSARDTADSARETARTVGHAA